MFEYFFLSFLISFFQSFMFINISPISQHLSLNNIILLTSDPKDISSNSRVALL